MNTTRDTEFDYQTYMRQTSPHPGQIQRGTASRHQRRDMEKSKITIRIDTDILEQFKQMVSDGQGYQSLINQALREWLVAQGIKDLVRQELKAMAAQIVASIQDVLTSSREHT
jgi:uncharacterized protein (DUF4415 family)